jgi:hypothetical protein
LASNTIYGGSRTHGRLWLGNNGLTRFDPATREAHLHKSDGLQGDEFHSAQRIARRTDVVFRRLERIQRVRSRSLVRERRRPPVDRNLR